MKENEILSRFGISSKLAYGLLIQSILVIISAIISLVGILDISDGITLRYITNLMSFITCISLIVYSFYGFNSKRNQEAFFISSICLYIILTILGLLTSAISLKNPVSILTVITLISSIFFLLEYQKNYKVANYAMLIIIITCIIVMLVNLMMGIQWFIVIKYIIITISIGLTYFERVQRGKYDFKI